MGRLSIEDVYEAPEVDLWGHVFVVRPLTKHMEERLGGLPDEVREKLEAAEKGDDLVALVGNYFDVTLKRVVEENGNGKRQAKPSTLLKQHWNKREGPEALSIEQLVRFFMAVHENSEFAAPPT